MSYIVKSRDFPKSCNECDEPHLCCDFYYCGVGHQKDGRHLDVDEHYLNKTKHPECPLKEIPTPHGRLIDADAHIKLLKENHCGERCRRNHDCSTCGIDMYIRIVENEPTVIKAEVSE